MHPDRVHKRLYHLILLHLNTNYFDHIDQLQMLTRANTVDINNINKFLSFINIDVNPRFKKWQLNIINFLFFSFLRAIS
jgi:hypothetical protein